MAPFIFDRPEVVKLRAAGGGDPRTKKRSWERNGMKRDFLEALGLEKETVDKIMAENGADLEREKAKTTAARADLADAQGKLSASLQRSCHFSWQKNLLIFVGKTLYPNYRKESAFDNQVPQKSE